MEIANLDNDGCFSFLLPKGEYKIDLEHKTHSGPSEEIDVKIIGPDEFSVQDSDVSGLNFNMYEYTEIIESNLDALKSIPLEVPTVEYRWGRVPLQSYEKCRQHANIIFKSEKEDFPLEIQPYLKLGEAVVFYDFKDNPIYYEYPIVYSKLDVDVAYFGVEALGIEPSIGRDAGSVEIKSKDDSVLKTLIGLPPYTSNGLIPRLIKELADERNIGEKEIEVEKLVFPIFSTGAILRIKSSNELVHVLLSGSLRKDTIDQEGLLFQQEVIEMYSTLQYIEDYKRMKKLPLIRSNEK